jgi:hypothetical protein
MASDEDGSFADVAFVLVQNSRLHLSSSQSPRLSSPALKLKRVLAPLRHGDGRGRIGGAAEQKAGSGHRR